MFPYEPSPTQYLDALGVGTQSAVGDILQPWIDLGVEFGISPFAAKALFALGMMQRYVLSANMVLKDLRHLGFLSACGLLGSGVELLGRCIHVDKLIRQDPVYHSRERLVAGFEFIRRPNLPPGVIVGTNHFKMESGGYSAQDLINLRNLAAHGGCLTKASQIKGDIELLDELRKSFFGIPTGAPDPAEGAIDHYYRILASGDREKCERLASAGISPAPLNLQQGSWRFDAIVVREIKQQIENNLALGRFPVSGDHTKAYDYFQLYP